MAVFFQVGFTCIQDDSILPIVLIISNELHIAAEEARIPFHHLILIYQFLIMADITTTTIDTALSMDGSNCWPLVAEASFTLPGST